MKTPIFFLLLFGLFSIVACQPISEITPIPLLTDQVTGISATGTSESSATFTPSSQIISTPKPEPDVTDLFSHMHGDSFSPVISLDGRYVVFVSRAGDLVEQDINQCPGIGGVSYNCSNIFVYDRQNGTLRLISVTSDGQQANGNSSSPAISRDGRWIAFVSEATNLTDERMGTQGLFLYDLQNEHLEMIAPFGEHPSISEDGRFVAYETSLSTKSIYLYDQNTDISFEISRAWDGQVADGDSIVPRISGNGRFVAFWSWAGNLIPNDMKICRENEIVNYSCGDVFIFDRETHQIQQIAVGEGYGLGMGPYSLSLSADGNLLAFNCQVFEREKAQILYKKSCGRISADGRFIAFRQDADYFVQELSTGLITQVSVASDGTFSNGEWVDFETTFEGESFEPGFGVSEDTNWIAFASTANNLASGDNQICADVFFASHNCYDIFIHNRETGLTEWISKPVGVQQ